MKKKKKIKSIEKKGMKTKWNEIHPINRRKLNTLQNDEIAEQLLFASHKSHKAHPQDERGVRNKNQMSCYSFFYFFIA